VVGNTHNGTRTYPVRERSSLYGDSRQGSLSTGQGGQGQQAHVPSCNPPPTTYTHQRASSPCGPGPPPKASLLIVSRKPSWPLTCW
jgi:hypothetical protein